MSSVATAHLQKQLRELQANPPACFRVEANDDLFKWTVWFSGPPDSPYEGGQFRALMTFPKEFPNMPPKFIIQSDFFHPFVYESGEVCISILHTPGEDEQNEGETAMMRWTPIHSIRSVLVSIISLFSEADPQEGAPANVTALSLYRSNRDEYMKRCAQIVKKSLSELPPDFVAPSMTERSAANDLSGPATSAPSGSQDPYASELQQLLDMNLATSLSTEELRKLLHENKGDIGAVLEVIFSS